jgi:hypothetical protein
MKSSFYRWDEIVNHFHLPPTQINSESVRPQLPEFALFVQGSLHRDVVGKSGLNWILQPASNVHLCTQQRSLNLLIIDWLLPQIAPG